VRRVRRDFLGLLVIFLLLACLSARAQDVLYPFDGDILYFKGNNAQPTGWRDADFAPGQLWLEGKLAIGYDEGGGYQITTDLPDMRQVAGGRPGYMSVFLRLAFELEDPYPVESLILKVKYDDGYIAYINGTKVAYGNMPNTNNPPHTVAALQSGEVREDTVDITRYKDKLLPGTNILAVQVHNSSITSSDLYFNCQLEATFMANPFVCISSPQCVDLGDGAVGFGWALPAGSDIDQIIIREEGVEDPIATFPGTELGGVVRGVAEGDHFYRLFASKGATECYGGVCQTSVSPIQSFIRGDVNDDGKINIVDPLFLAHYLFQGGDEPGCHDAGDTDDSGKLDIADVVALLEYLFKLGTPPAPPGPSECGPDENLDTLPKCEYQHCEEAGA